MGFKAKCRVAAVVVSTAFVGLAVLYGLLTPAPSGCIMTYMYPTYVPISMSTRSSYDKYGLFLYHEGWKKIDFGEHLKKLNGVPIMFIPGNGGSYKQVRSLAAESSRAFQGGPPKLKFYRESLFFEGMNSALEDAGGFSLPNQYSKMLDWFAVDLEGEHSAMDGRIVEEHAEYVVHAIHKVLDQYKESRDALSKEGGDISGNLPTSVILVGHSMGGFVARAAVVHPHLRKQAVETILTLSTPHQSPPLALQPSLGHYYSQVNMDWKRGYEIQPNHAGQFASGPKLSNVIVVSISGGINDYQVRTKLSSLDGIVPASHGFMLSSSGTKNAWVSVDHQSILWCNQLVVQISHTLLSMINPETGQSHPSTQRRLLIFTQMLQSGVPRGLNWNKDVYPSDMFQPAAVSQLRGNSSCPAYVQWADDSLEKDLYIQSATVTVLAMDGKRRWLDIKKLGSNGSAHFVFVTNLIPCSGVRIHLWREKSSTSHVESANKITEVTSKMVHIPSGPAPRQIEPGSQTEQAPPSALLLLTPYDLHGFRFLTISVAPRPSVSGRPPPAVSMAVGQFFNPEDGMIEFSPWTYMHPRLVQEGIFLKEGHPLSLNLSFSISLGLLPVTLSVQTIGCGIKKSSLPVEQAGDTEHGLCKLRCFPPVALAWDSMSGLYVIPNLLSETLVVDSSPAFWDLNHESGKTSVLLMVDPHCSYKITAPISLSAAASRLVLSYSSLIAGFLVAVLFFALMQQARFWEQGLPVPSIITAIELNLRAPMPLFLLAVVPLFVPLGFSFLNSQKDPPVGSLIAVSIFCYMIANGSAIALILCSKMILYMIASLHVLVKICWQAWEENFCIILLKKIFGFSSVLYSFKVMRILKGNPNLVVSFVAIPLVCFVHPALGLLVLLLFHTYCCHTALFSFLATSFRSLSQQNEVYGSKTTVNQLMYSKFQPSSAFNQLLPLDEGQSGNPNSGGSFGDKQIEIFNYRHGLLVLHIVAAVMFVPSLIAWLQRIGMSQSFPWFIDSVLCMGIIFHGLCGWKPDIRALKFPFPIIRGSECGLSLVYLLCGYYSYLSALTSSPYKACYAMATVGAISFASRFIEKRNGERSDGYFNNRGKHSHKN